MSREEDEFEEGQERWRREQQQLTDDLNKALARYRRFHEQGFDSWFHEWKKRRRIK